MRLATLLLCLVSMTITRTMEAQTLKDYQWKHRILILVDDNPYSDALTSQRDALKSEKKELSERDLVIFIATPSKVLNADGTEIGINAKKLYKDYDLNADFIGVLLVGKDGDVKMRESFEVAPQKIFTLIDGMPMRRREMRESGGN